MTVPATMMNSPKAIQAPSSGASASAAAPDAGRQRARQRIDDAAEQHRLDELRRGERDIRQRQCHRERGVGAEQAKHAKIDAGERHGGGSSWGFQPESATV